MKASEAPKKLWWSKGAVWHTNPNSKRYIEYTRTDAFIEKACEWLRTHGEVDYFELIPFNYCGAGNLNKKKMIEDFKKYMEE